MKTRIIFSILISFAILSCKSPEKPTVQKVSFGIYETVKIKDIPVSVIEKLKTLNVQLERDSILPIAGYVLKTDSTQFPVEYARENIKLVKTIYTVDKEFNYNALIATKLVPGITNSDIKQTKNMRKNVEIHFTMSGARKWAEMIKNNQGNMVAFVIDNQVYSLPYINGEINNGSALISGIENETIARQISDALNAGISD